VRSGRLVASADKIRGRHPRMAFPVVPARLSRMVERKLAQPGRKKAHTGFEPVLGENPIEEPPLPEHDEVAAPELPAELQRVVERIMRRERARGR